LNHPLKTKNKIPDTFEIEGWGSEKPIRFKLEPDFELSKYKGLLKDQIKSLDESITSLNIVNPEITDALKAVRPKVNYLDNGSHNNFDKQRIYFTQPYILSGFMEENKYLLLVVKKLDKSKRIALHFIKLTGLNFLLVTSKILLIPILKRFVAPLLGLKNNINKDLEKIFSEVDIIYTDSISWLLSHMLYINCEIIFCRKLNAKYEPDHYRNVPFTIRAAIQNNIDILEKNKRLIVHDHLSDDGNTLKAIKGLLSKDDAILIHGDNLPTVLSKCNSVIEVDEGYFLCKEMPEEWSINYIPSEPSGGWPKISVVTVSYNQVEFIEDCLKSILNQGYPNLEYIVIDGQSTDGTIDVLDRYKNRINHLIIEPDDGQSNALNKGFNKATGEIMTWICSDDMLTEGALFHIGQTFSEHKVDLVVGGCKIITESGDVIRHHHTEIPLDEPVFLSFSDMLNFMGSWHKGRYFYQPEIFFSKNIWELSGSYLKEHLYYAMDYDMFLRMGMSGADILHISRMIGVSRQHNKQKTQYLTKEYLPQIKMIMEEYLEMIDATILTAN
jgi:glycosyl transferase family 2